MFEIGWTEMLVIAVVLIVVVGPKDLPRMLRTFGRTTAKLRVMAGDFRKQFDEALKEAELDDVKSVVDEARKLNPASDIRKALSPMQKAADEVRAGLSSLNSTKPKPMPSPEPASTVVQPAEPAKAGPVAVPGESGQAVAVAEAPTKETAARPVARPVRAKAKTAASASASAKAKTGAPKKAPRAAAKPKSVKAASRKAPK